MEYQFADGFWWGSATSAPQSEGAAARDGKSRNIFDYWYEIAPERFHDRVGPAEASTFYDHFRTDIGLLKTLGHNTFRTSISWSRLIPDGDGEVNPQAVAFYNAMIDELLAQGITPFINLYHFDMPLCMQQRGGWENRAVVEAYARYADICFGLFGDRVTHWFTFNEPIVPVEAGYLNDLHYPCVVDFKRAITVAYHSVLAHAMAVQRFRARGLPGSIGIILNLSPTYPRSDAPEDLQAAHDADLLLNRSFLDPVAKGRYPAALLHLLAQHGLMPYCEPQDAQLIEGGVVDILGVNYYQPRRVQAKEGRRAGEPIASPEDLFSYYVMPGRKINPHRGWEIYEKGLYDILMDLKENYGNLPCYISENGMGVEGEEAFIGADGRVEDDYRIEFIRDHLKWLHRALAEGSQCKGYHLWTFIDCWSWLNAYKNRYGLVRLDRAEQRRTIKKSGYWFAEAARRNGFDYREAGAVSDNQISLSANDVKLIREQDFFNCKDFHLFIYNKVESATGLHQHDYYEFTIVLSGKCYQEINGKRVLLERGDFVFIPIGSYHQSFYEFGATKIFNVAVSKAFFEEHYLQQLPRCFVASQAYSLRSEFLAYIESVVSSPQFREDDFAEFLETLTFYVISRIRHYKEDNDGGDDIPQWLKNTLAGMHDKAMFGERALANMVALSGKTQEYLTRAMRRYYQKTPMQVINEIRINFAKTQLEVTNYSVSDIAFDSGYGDVSLFIKNFKRLTDVTPGNYRKKCYGPL